MQFLSRHSTRLVFAGLALSAVCGWLASSTLISADEEKPAASSGKEPNKEAPVRVSDIPPSTFVVPAEGDARTLLRFIHKLEALRPEFKSEEEAQKFLGTSRNAVIAAADQLLAGRAKEEEQVDALKSKLQAYQVLLVVGVKDAFPKALAFAEQLKNDRRPVLAEMGEAAWIDFKMSTVPTIGPQERRAIINMVARQLERKPQAYFQFAQALEEMLEKLGDGQNAAAAFATFGEILSKNLDEEMRAAGENMKTGAVRRARLLAGDPLKIAGTTVDGKPFNINDYKGKVVVVDFWATWCGPCKAELPNLIQLYKKYHPQGLEVVGVSLDKSRENLVNFLKEQNLPWTILASTEGRHTEFDNPIAEYYGVAGIPTFFLVSKEGKVISSTARGEEINELVAGLISGQIVPPSEGK